MERSCWCDSSQLTGFSTEYKKCLNCETLISQVGLSPQEIKVKNDTVDFYGQQYWLSHQAQDLGYPDIFQRSRLDLPERCLFWLKNLLKYKLPKAKTIELGCAHGGFVALQHFAGYEAQGLELSHWVVEFARQTFGVEVLEGPIEEQNIAKGTYDVISMMDVFEHLSDPMATLRSCLGLLKPDGILIIQTPCFQPEMTYERMLTEKSAFLQHLKADEHLYLVTQNGIKKFFELLGVKHIAFEPAIFAHYDMSLVVSCQPLKIYSDEEIQARLSATPQGRMIQALLDLKKNWEISEADRAARLDVINCLNDALQAREKNIEPIKRQSMATRFYKRLLRKDLNT